MIEIHDQLEIDALRDQATKLAGTTADLVQRACVYHHLYAHSGGNHSFPLLAAHGALWASGYFKAGIRFGALVATARGLWGDDRRALTNSLNSFAEQFRDINRRVCIETLYIYHLTEKQHLRRYAELHVPRNLLDQMDICHAARIGGYRLSDSARRDLFDAFFLWEQNNIVGPAIDAAFASFDWPLIRKMAQKPTIRFAYFGNNPLRFNNFSDTDERILMGRHAFDKACLAGWNRVEQAMSDYGIMPRSFIADPARYFIGLTDKFCAVSGPSTYAFTSA